MATPPVDPFDLDAARHAIEAGLERGEDSDEVLELASHLARRRADLLGREANQPDLEFALATLCWWPGKTKPPAVHAALVRIRSQLLRDPGLTDAVFNDWSLTMTLDELRSAQQEGTSYLVTDAVGGDADTRGADA